MKTASRNAATAPHCTQRTPSGRFCRLPIADPASALCFRHALELKQHTDAVNLAAALTSGSDEFQSAVGIHASLSSLYKLLAEDKISARRAAVLAYISNLLLRAIPLAVAELEADLSDSGDRVIVDCEFPRPVPDPQPPSPALVEQRS